MGRYHRLSFFPELAVTGLEGRVFGQKLVNLVVNALVLLL